MCMCVRTTPRWRCQVPADRLWQCRGLPPASAHTCVCVCGCVCGYACVCVCVCVRTRTIGVCHQAGLANAGLAHHAQHGLGNLWHRQHAPAAVVASAVVAVRGGGVWWVVCGARSAARAAPGHTRSAAHARRAAQCAPPRARCTQPLCASAPEPHRHAAHLHDQQRVPHGHQVQQQVEVRGQAADAVQEHDGHVVGHACAGH
jgi:hypothetical protein